MTAGASLPPADEQRPAPPLTEEELVAMEVRCEAATPGPWTHAGGLMDTVWSDARGHVVTDAEDDDGPFIAHARTDVPRLIADLRASRAEVERLRAFLVATLDHGTTLWSDTSCGGGGVGGQAMTTTAHPEVIQHLVSSALQDRSLAEAADDYAACDAQHCEVG